MGIKSKIHDELAKAAGVNPKDGQSITDQDYMKNLTRAVAKLPDSAWNELSDKAGDFHNKLADALNAKKDLPEYPDAEKTKDAEEEAPRRRRRSAEDEEEAPRSRSKAYEPAKGDKVKLTSTKGKEYTGTVVDPDDDGELVLDVDGEELGFKADRVQSVVKVEEEEAPRRRRAAEDEDEAAPADVEPEVSDTVEVKTKRGVKVGNVVEMTDDIIVIKDSTGEELEYSRSRVESITVKVKNAGKKAGGGKAKKEEAPEEKAGKVTKDENGGVSVTLRIREIMCEEPSDPISLADLGKRIEKAGLVCKDNTLKMVHADCTKIFGILKANKKLK